MENQSVSDKVSSKEQIDETISQLRSRLQEPDSPRDQLYYLLGNAYRKRGDFSEALTCYNEAAALNPDSPAVCAREMLTDIIEFYHKDYYNP